MNEQGELARAICELRQEIGGLKEEIGGLREATRENTAAIKDLSGRVDKLDSTMEQVKVSLAGKLGAVEIAGFVESTNMRIKRIEQQLELA